jgi:hypothetical protein
MATFDMEKFLMDQGMEITGPSQSPGVVKVMGMDGSEKMLNVDKLANDMGAKNYQLNKPSAALDESPVGFLDRGKLAVGNARGSLEFLKRKFQDAKYVENDGLVVKEGGFWKRVDPNGVDLGDAWDVAKALGEGAAVGAAGTAGAVAGLATGGLASGAASVAAAGAAGAGVKGLESILGKAFGTYSATASEVAQDIAFEGLLSAAGQGVALGVKAALPSLRNALSEIGKNAAPATKEIIAGTLQKATGARLPSVNIAMENADEVVREMSNAAKKYGTSGQVRDGLKIETVNLLKTFADDADDALKSNYSTMRNQILDAGVSTKNVTGMDLAHGFASALQKTGLVQTNEKGMLRLITDKEFAKAVESGIDNLTFPSVEYKEALQPLLNNLNRLSVIMPKLQGKPATRMLLDSYKDINSMVDTVFNANEKLGSVLKEGRTAFKQVMVDKMGLPNFNMFEAMNNNYSSKVDLVRKLTAAVKDVEASESFANKLLMEYGQRSKSKEIISQLQELFPKEANDILKRIATKQAAADFSPYLSRAGLVPQIAMGGAGAAIGAGGGPLAMAGLAGTAAATSPRLAIHTLRLSQMALKAMKSLPSMERLKLIQNADAFQAWSRGWLQEQVDQKIRGQAEGLATQATQGGQK